MLDNNGTDERAVSPVIGVILMVAITVILAAVIAAFVLDLGQSQSASATAGIEFSQDGTEVTVQRMTEGDVDTIYVRAETSADTYWVDSSGDLTTTTTDRSGQIASPGQSLDIETDSGTNGDLNNDIDTITLIGVNDGSETVMQSYDP